MSEPTQGAGAGERVLRAQVVEGNDANSVLIDVWLNGFITGAASGVHTILMNHPHADVDPDRVVEYAHMVALELQGKGAEDPLYREAILHTIGKLFRAQAGATAGEVHLPSDGESP